MALREIAAVAIRRDNGIRATLTFPTRELFYGDPIMMADDTRPRGWRFTDGTRVFTLYPEQRKFLAGDTEIDLGQRPFDLLVFLVENAGRLARRSEILSRVWQTRSAAVSTVSTQVSIVRNAIGDDCIATINSKGYQFTLPVEPIAALLPPPLPQAPLITLPHPSGGGVGRADEIEQLAEHCRQRRLVTIVGAGGVGKTWLAIQVGWRLVPEFPDGVHLIDLGPVKEPVAVAGTVAQALGIALRGRDDPARVLAAVIGKQRMLLVFDSCEYMAGPVRELAKGLLAQAPNLSILATSQEILRVPKEMVFRLEPLPEADAVSLFVDCARAADHLFRHEDGNAAAVAEICRRLDGIPLALEMAGALVPSLGIEGVRDGLDLQRFEMFDSWPRVTDDARQRTLSAMLDWSCGLLDGADRQVFRRLAAFRGSFSGEAAVAAVGADDAKPWNVMASLGRLVDKSLLVSERGPRRRYRMLETMALHAAALLEDSGEADMIAERLVQYYIPLFERAELAWESMPDNDWLALYRPEIDNIRAALDWALGNPARRQIAIALAGSTSRLWERSALLSEGRKYLDRAVALIDDQTPTTDAARVLRYAAALWRSADRRRSAELMGRSAELYRSVGDMLGYAAALGGLGGAYLYLGQNGAAGAALAEARALLEGTNWRKSLSNAINDLGSLALLEGDLAEARRCYMSMRALMRDLDDHLRDGIALANLGEVEFQMGAIDRAIAVAQDAVSSLRSTEHRSFRLPALVNLASYQLIGGDREAARGSASDALPLAREEGGHGLRLCTQVFALLAAQDRRYAEAAQLGGFVDAGYAASGEVRESTERRIAAELSAILAKNCRPADLQTWAVDASGWDEQRIVDLILEKLVDKTKNS
jgi:predicted ATPase/DNA-binding winged helix-turn-helix (wHTH) protein